MIVVAGEALLDVFLGAQTPEGVALDARVGGSPFNVAVGLARLAQPVAFLGAIGRGPLGERLVRALAAEGVDLRCVQRVAAPTTLGLAALDAVGVPEYSFYGAGGADRQLSAAALDALPATTGAIHIGSYATVVEPIATTLATLIERERSRHVISYDPNVRLNVESDITRWRSRVAWLVERAHLVKVSEEDLALLYPGGAIDDIAPQWRTAGAAVVVVTRGAHGASAWCAGGRVDVEPVPVTVVDTVGAGDTLQAALLTWLAEQDRLSIASLRALSRDSLRAALRFATRAAAITCSRRGANLPRRAEVPDGAG
jgi:fructokinase